MKIDAHMKTILYVHQSADLYGSDKVLLNIVSNLDRTRYEPIVIVPNHGELVGALQAFNVETHVATVLKVERRYLKSMRVFRLLFDASQAVKAIDIIVGNRKVALVHSNTLAVLGGAIWAWKRNIPHVWHVHEILLSPWLIRKGYPILVARLADKVICNSKATKSWLIQQAPALETRAVVIWNGIDPPDASSLLPIEVVRARLGIIQSDIVIGLIGRINSWKGHHLLLKAAELLWREGYQDVRYLIVGSTAPGQHYWIDKLYEQIAHSPVGSKFTIAPYNNDIYAVWRAVDIAVVPSTAPEPFGIVAVEAMAIGKPVVAAAHGGLLDIVSDNVTGLLFEPNNPKSLAKALATLISSRRDRERMGKAGQSRQVELFSMRRQMEGIMNCYYEMGA